MADSETKTEPQVDPSNPSGVTSVAVRNRDGSVRLMNKDSSGKFMRKPKALPPAIEVTRIMRKFLAAAEKGAEETRLMKILNNIADIAMCDQVDIETGQRDAKMAMASVKAFEALWLRTYGKPSPSDEEKDMLKQSGVKIVIIEQPKLEAAVYNPETAEAKKTQPTFAEAEVVETNK